MASIPWPQLHIGASLEIFIIAEINTPCFITLIHVIILDYVQTFELSDVRMVYVLKF